MKKQYPTLAACCLLLPTLAQAGGIYLYETATADTSFASAGTAARAEDATTIYANPAGMTRLDGNQMSLGLQALHGDADYQMDNPNLKGPGNIIGWLPGGSAFYSHSIDERLKLGIGAYGNFGMALDFGDWAGDTAVTDNTLMAMTIQPTAAYKLNDLWSLGVGMTANYGIFVLERNPQYGEHVSIEDEDWGYGARIGLMYEPDEASRLGLVWGSKVALKFDLDPASLLATGLDSPTVNANINAPQNLMFSGYHRLNPTWAIMGNLGWQDWSRFAQSTVNNNESRLELQDTWHLAFGGQYSLTQDSKLNGGIAYDSSFYKSQNETAFLMPGGEAYRFGTGLQHSLNDQSDINLALEYVMVDGQHSDAGLLSGRYDKVEIWVMSVQYNHHF